MWIGKLRRDRKNLVVERIQQQGVDPVAEFRWEEVESGRTEGLLVDRLSHNATGHFYTFDLEYLGDDSGISHTLHYSYCSPPQFTGGQVDWADQFANFCGWLDYIKKEMDTPDLWGILLREKKLATSAGGFDAPNTPFTPEEQSLISERLNEIQARIVGTHKLLEKHTETLSRGFEELQASLRRMGRRDWIYFGVGIVWTTVTGLALGGEQAKQILLSIWNGIREVFGMIRPLP